MLREGSHRILASSALSGFMRKKPDSMDSSNYEQIVVLPDIHSEKTGNFGGRPPRSRFNESKQSMDELTLEKKE